LFKKDEISSYLIDWDKLGTIKRYKVLKSFILRILEVCL